LPEILGKHQGKELSDRSIKKKNKRKGMKKRGTPGEKSKFSHFL
jgi:hypothetical protein